MNFENWLILNKGLSLKTASLYEYYVSKTDDFILEYNSLAHGSTKKLLYYAQKLHSEYRGEEFPILEPPKGSEEKVMRYVTYNEYMNISSNYISENSMWSINGKLIAELTFIYGMRISEALNVKWTDIVDGSFYIRGKGKKVRSIPASPIFERLSNVNEGFIVNSNGRRLGYGTARNILEDISSRLNIDDVTWHSFRHGFAVRMLSNKIDIYKISKLMGHSSLQTTASYLKYDSTEIRGEFKKLGLFA